MIKGYMSICSECYLFKSRFYCLLLAASFVILCLPSLYLYLFIYFHSLAIINPPFCFHYEPFIFSVKPIYASSFIIMHLIYHCLSFSPSSSISVSLNYLLSFTYSFLNVRDKCIPQTTVQISNTVKYNKRDITELLQKYMFI